jgi:tetratricopeptide (TPR) repeat protein
VQLFLDGQASEALPLLEAGFAGRERVTFASLDDLGMCALALGGLRDDIGDPDGALGAYAVALEVFQTSKNHWFEGTTLNNIGLVYGSQGHYPEALEYYQQALAILREMGDRATEGAILSNIGQIYDFQGRYAEALEAYQQALAIAREVGDRAGEGGALNNIGRVYDQQGRHAEALEAYQQALAIAREMGDRAGEGTTLNNIGAVCADQDRYMEALEYFRQALAIRREVGDRAGEGTTLNNIGAVCADHGRYAEALEYFRQALAIQREVGDRAGEGLTLSNIGKVYHSQGRYAEAMEVLQQTLAIYGGLGARAGEGTTLNSIGEIYDSQGRYTEALEYYRQALAILHEVSAGGEKGATLHNIGIAYGKQALYVEALDFFQQALAIRREVGDRVGEAATLSSIGTVYDRQERYTEALEAYQQALAIRREVDDPAGEAATLGNIGAVYHDQGRYAEALDFFQQALAISRKVGDQVGEGLTLQNIGLVYQQQGQVDEALDYYEQAMGILESVRTVAGSEPGRVAFIAQYADLYYFAVWTYDQQGQGERAFYTSERGRARAFLDSMATGYVELSDNAAADLRAREQEAYAARQTAQDALARARAQQPPDPVLVADLEAQLTQAEQEHAAALAAIEARSGQLKALVPGRSTVLGLPEVQALLGEQTTLISFWVLKDKTLAFVVTHDVFHTVALKVSQEDLLAQITDFRNFPNLEAAYPESAVTLYTALIAPLKAYLTTPHLVIVPHGVLHYLPFAALTDGQHYLLNDYVITYLPSASVLPFIQENTGHTGGLPLILGNPAIADFDTTASLATERDSLGPLPFAEQEAEAIAVLYGAEALTGTAAAESVVRERAGEVGFLHLAAHGRYNPVAPLSSLVALARDKANDGWLTVREIYGLDLRKADLVVLSACETQLGELSAGDEVVGMTRAFFFAGTPTVVASLWSVDDRSTGLLMERFYTHLREGMDKAEALRQAQLEVRAEYPNPYYWSAFVLSGGGGKLGDISRTPTSPDVDKNRCCCCPSLALPLMLVGLAGMLAVGRKMTRSG